MPLKSSKGGCSSQGYSDVSKNFMLLDSAIKTTGGRRSKSAKKSSMKKSKVGKQHRRRYGGEGEEPPSPPDASSDAPPVAPPPASPPSDAQGTASYMPPAESLGLGSAFSGVMKNLTGGKKSKKSKRNGGCGFGSTNCNKAQKKGGTGVELAPFISSLVLLGLRVGNDKMLQSGVTKQLSDMVKSKSSAKKSSTKKTSTKKSSTKKTTTRKTTSKLF